MGALCLSLSLLAVELTVVVAPYEVLGLSAEQSAALQRWTEDLIREGRRDRTLIPASELERARQALEIPTEELPACLHDTFCAARLARQVGADELLRGSAAGLGRTFVLRLTLIDAHRSVVDREVEGTVVGGFEDLSEALPEQLERLLPSRSRWYTSWWFWTVVGAVVAGTTLAIVLPLALDRGDDIPRYDLP